MIGDYTIEVTRITNNAVQTARVKNTKAIADKDKSNNETQT
jgi:hypothetical protein